MKCRKLVTNLIKQDCYVLDYVPPFDEKNDYLQKSFCSLDTVVDENGTREVLTKQAYPITPDSVNSFAASCDYKIDPLSAISQPQKGSYVDVGEIQRLSRMDSVDLQNAVEALRTRLKTAQEVLQAKSVKGTTSTVSDSDSSVRGDDDVK